MDRKRSMDAYAVAQFIESNIVDKLGRKIVVHPWMLDEVFRPLLGFKRWVREDEERTAPCARCRSQHDTIADSIADAERAPHDDCPGLAAHKIRVVLVNLKRQQGKTTTGACFALAEQCLGRNIDGTYVGSTGSQGDRVWKEKFLHPVEANAQMSKRITLLEKRMKNPRQNNDLNYIAPSPRASVGTTKRRLYIDEVRDLEPRVVIRLLATVIASDSMQCASGHWAGRIGERDECPVCGEELDTLYGTALLMSNAGQDEGVFYELLEELRSRPDRAYHLFSSADTLNHYAESGAEKDLNRVFARLPSTQHLVRQELGNVFTREGDEYLPADLIEACAVSVMPADGSDVRCVGFLDCSRTQDLTSSVIAGDPESAGDLPPPDVFARLETMRIDVWDPSRTGRVDYRAIYDWLHDWLPKFPRLIEYWIDVSLIADAQELYDKVTREPWGKMVRAWRGSQLANKEAWDALERRVLEGSIRYHDNPRLVRELKNAKVRRTQGGSLVVVDRSRSNSRGRLHRDISYSLAGCCWIAERFRGRDVDAVDRRLDKINRSERSAAKPLTAGLRGRRW